MKTLLHVFVEQANSLQGIDLDLAIACICNARCCRDISPQYQRTLDQILCDMQTAQRAQWRGGK